MQHSGAAQVFMASTAYRSREWVKAVCDTELTGSQLLICFRSD